MNHVKDSPLRAHELLARLRSEFADLGHHISIHGAASSSYMARPQALKGLEAELTLPRNHALHS